MYTYGGLKAPILLVKKKMVAGWRLKTADPGTVQDWTGR